MEELRTDTISLINFVVGGLENTYLDYPSTEPMTLDEAVEYCYQDLKDNTNQTHGHTSAVYFNTTEAIKEELKEAIIDSEIRIK